MFKSKKFIGMIIGVVVIVAIIVICAIFAPDALNPNVIAAAIWVIGFLIVAYIGGNTFTKYIVSAHFNEQLFKDGKDE